jgi:polyhydroxyalkanoate synthesis regulator protein
LQQDRKGFQSTWIDSNVTPVDARPDLTAAVPARIIFEEEDHQPHLPAAALRRVIQTGRIL